MVFVPKMQMITFLHALYCLFPHLFLFLSSEVIFSHDSGKQKQLIKMYFLHFFPHMKLFTLG